MMKKKSLRETQIHRTRKGSEIKNKGEEGAIEKMDDKSEEVVDG